MSAPRTLIDLVRASIVRACDRRALACARHLARSVSLADSDAWAAIADDLAGAREPLSEAAAALSCGDLTAAVDVCEARDLAWEGL